MTHLSQLDTGHEATWQDPAQPPRSVWIAERFSHDGKLMFRSAFLHHENATDGEARARAHSIYHPCRNGNEWHYAAVVHCKCPSAPLDSAKLIAGEEDTMRWGQNYHGLVDTRGLN